MRCKQLSRWARRYVRFSGLLLQSGRSALGPQETIRHGWRTSHEAETAHTYPLNRTSTPHHYPIGCVRSHTARNWLSSTRV